MLFSFYRRPVTTTRPERVIDPRMCAKYILSPYSLPSTDLVRSTTTPDDRKAAKRQQLDYITAGGVFRSRKLANLSSISGGLLLDFDHVADLDSLRRFCVLDLRPLLAWISPSGEGLKVLIDVRSDMMEARIPLDQPTDSHTIRERAASVYRDLYSQAMQFVECNFGGECGADLSASDITRATYLNCDFTCYVNPCLL